MKMKELIVLILVTFSFPCVSLADTIHIYGLTSDRKENDSDVALLNSITSKLENDGHTVTSSHNVTKKKFKQIEADWIIYVGHGVSCSSRISRNVDGTGLTDPGELSWKANGILLFACSVIDIGDFGSINPYCDEVDGNFCKKYYDNKPCADADDYKIINPAFPDPGLEWEEMARKNGIGYILGFNFTAPEVSRHGKKVIEGYNLLVEFIDIWIDKGIEKEESFIKAWKSDLTTSVQGKDDRDRGYIRCEGMYHNGCNYSIGNDGIWPSIYKVKGYKNWEESVWYYGQESISTEMTIDDYRKCLFTGFANESEMHARELCLRGILHGYEEDGKILFKPKNLITRKELLKIIVRAADIPHSNAQITFTDLNEGKPLPVEPICGGDEYDWPIGCCRDFAAANIIGGYPDGTCRPGSKVNRSELTKIVVNAFFNNNIPEESTCAELQDYKIYGEDLKEKGFYCHFIKAAFAKNCKIYRSTDSFPGFTQTNFGPDQPVTREEVAIIVNRARRLKESGVNKCGGE